MRVLLGILCMAVTFHIGLAQAAEEGKSAATVYKTKKLGKTEIDQLLAQPDKLVLIDVRRPDEVTKIGGFPAYLSIQSADLEKYLAYIPKDRKVVTVSNHAGRALKTGDILIDKGFHVAGAIGAQNYEEEGGKLTKIEPPSQPATAQK